MWTDSCRPYIGNIQYPIQAVWVSREYKVSKRVFERSPNATRDELALHHLRVHIPWLAGCAWDVKRRLWGQKDEAEDGDNYDMGEETWQNGTAPDGQTNEGSGGGDERSAADTRMSDDQQATPADRRIRRSTASASANMGANMTTRRGMINQDPGLPSRFPSSRQRRTRSRRSSSSGTDDTIC